MASRGLLGFVVDGNAKISYVHDSNPATTGVNVLRFARQLAKDHAIPEAAQRARDLTVVDGASYPTSAQVKALDGWRDDSVHAGVPGGRYARPSWYQLLRRTQGDPDAILTAGYVEDESAFALNTVWCEWVWLIDFDHRVIEVYRPMGQGMSPRAGRWVGHPADADGYYPPDRVGLLALDDLPTDEGLIWLFG